MRLPWQPPFWTDPGRADLMKGDVMPSFNLERDEVDRLVNILANAPVPWVVVNPLLQKISQQAQAESPRRGRPPVMRPNGAEAQSHEAVTDSQGT